MCKNLNKFFSSKIGPTIVHMFTDLVIKLNQLVGNHPIYQDRQEGATFVLREWFFAKNMRLILRKNAIRNTHQLIGISTLV